MTALPTAAARWIHHDEQLSARLGAASARASAGDWSSGALGERVACLRALVIDTGYQIAKLQGSVSRVTTGAGAETLYIDPRCAPGVSEPRRRAASRLYRTWDLLAQSTQIEDVETFAEGAEDTGALPVVAIVALIVVGGAALAYCGAQAIKVVDRQLERDARAAELVAAHSTALAVVDKHTAREDAAGKPLPLDEASRAALDALATEQEKIAGRTLPDFGDFPGLGSSASTFGTGAVVGLLAAGAALLIAIKQGVI